jgi:carbon-monoxide dehydrogenase medium subunit
MSAEFEYYQPRTLPEALSLLEKSGPGMHILAGGTDLLVWVKQKTIRPQAVLDIKTIKELHGLKVAAKGQGLIGPLTTARELIEWCEDIGKFKNLKTAASRLGSPIIRNRATIGGNLCTASPAGDLSLALLSYDTRVVIQGPTGQRTLGLQEFFKGPGQMDLAAHEMLVEIQVTPPPEQSGEAFFKLGLRKALQCSVVSVAATVIPEVNEPDKIGHVFVALGAVAPTPMRATRAQSVLAGRKWSSQRAKKAARVAAEECAPLSDIRASKDYRREMISVLTLRVLNKAWEETRKNVN